MDQYLTGPISSACTTRNLRYQLERTLGPLESQEGRARINTHHAHERHIREIMALR
jgi:hypothetical protein